MGTFERLSVVVIGVILVMILVVAVVTWTEEPEEGCLPGEGRDGGRNEIARLDAPPPEPLPPLPDPFPPAPGPVPPIPDSPPPAPSPEPAPEPTPDPRPSERIVHEVAEGDTLSGIAEKYLPSHKYWPAIVKINPDLDPNALRLGQRVSIPTEAELGLENEDKPIAPKPGPRVADAQTPGGTWTVRQGDDLRKIAKHVYRNLERWPDIWLANREKVQNPDDVPEGIVLALPE